MKRKGMKFRDVESATLLSLAAERRGGVFARKELVLELVKRRESAVIPVLEAMGADSSAALRCFAVWQLGELGSDKAHDTALALLKDHDPLVCLEAIECLEKVGTRAALGPLADFDAAADSGLKRAAQKARARIGRRDGRGAWVEVQVWAPGLKEASTAALAIHAGKAYTV